MEGFCRLLDSFFFKQLIVMLHPCPVEVVGDATV